ncbi:type II and III secretion system protein family protein [Cereibacter sp. SYSU M97828]|nr:type II and III secretion system protein family protein [Cereibacter flavus]
MRRMIGMAVALLLLTGLAAAAQTVDARYGETLRMHQGEGRIIRFDQPVSDVFLADATIADVRVISPQVVYAHALEVGITDMMALNADGVTVGSVEMSVTEDARPLAERQRAVQPGSTISLRMFGDAPSASGNAASLSEAIDTADTLESYAAPDGPVFNNSTMSGPNQVNIRVRFAEVSRSQLLQYGISWGVFDGGGSFNFGLVTGLGNARAGNLGYAGHSWDGGRVDVLLDALQQNGVLTILAEPNITAVTGETASFLAGGEVPVPVPVGGDQVGIEYKQFGVSLLFTPTLLPNGRVSMRVRPEVSSLAGSGVVEIAGLTVPSLQVRRADTTVEVGSGQTFAIAGLFQRDAAQQVNKVPLLGDVPILGQLFRSSRFQRSETELVILITPYLVEPVSERTLKTPLDSPRGALSSPVASRPKVNAGYGFYVQ